MYDKIKFLRIGTSAAILNYANEGLPIGLMKNHAKGDIPTMICSDPIKMLLI